ncbi:MAG TPA: tetratricopeptide repeat protein, partial [Methanospirillum sp.]|uniref:tetratricopeptide repeat protein n=1 Tax=Methanospirillum sp. TaxID=45200 RepID=UPI002B9A0B5D
KQMFKQFDGTADPSFDENTQEKINNPGAQTSHSLTQKSDNRNYPNVNEKPVPVVSAPSGDNKQTVDMISLGNNLQAKGNIDEAIKSFDRAIKSDQNNAVALNNKGTALVEKGEFDKALDIFNQALKIDPDYKEAWNNKGIILKYQGKNAEAIEAFNKVLKIDPNDKTALKEKANAQIKMNVNANVTPTKTSGKNPTISTEVPSKVTPKAPQTTSLKSKQIEGCRLNQAGQAIEQSDYGLSNNAEEECKQCANVGIPIPFCD